MRMTLPHELGREEVRRRLKERSHEIADHLPGDMAQVETQWPSDDQMNLAVTAMGQQVHGTIEISDTSVVLDFTLPFSLSFFKPLIESTLKSKGQKLLEKTPD